MEPETRDVGSVDKGAQWQWSEKRQVFVPVSASINPTSVEFTQAGTHTLVSVASDRGLVVVWLQAQARESVGDTPVLVTFKLGGVDIYKVELVGSMPWPHRTLIEGGLDDDLQVELSANAAVICSADTREYK